MNHNFLWTTTCVLFAALNLYWNIFGNYNVRYLNIYNGGTEFIPIQNDDFSNLCNEVQFQCKTNNTYDIEFVESILDYRIPDDILYMDTTCQDPAIYQKLNSKIIGNSYAYFQHSLLPDSLWHFQIEHKKGNHPIYLRMMDDDNFNLWKLNLPFQEEMKPIKILSHNKHYIPIKIKHDPSTFSYKKRNIVLILDYKYYSLFNQITNFNNNMPSVDISVNYIVKPKKICTDTYKKFTITCENQKTPWLSFPDNGQGFVFRPHNHNSFVDKFYCR